MHDLWGTGSVVHLKLLSVQVAELRRSAVSDDLEHPHEGGNAVESASYRYFRNVDIRIEKELFRVGDPSCVQIFVERHSSKFFEQAAEVIFGKSRHTSQRRGLHHI